MSRSWLITESEGATAAFWSTRRIVAGVGVFVGIGIGIAFKNPAFGLLAGLAVRLILDVNPVPTSAKMSKVCLQTAIVLLGFTLGLDQLIAVSANYGLLVAAYVIATGALGVGLAWLIVGNKEEQTLLTAGTGICGGTAIATLAPLMGAKPHQFAVASAIVFLLNIIAVFTFPMLGSWLQLSQETFGAWVALAVHDTSSVIATAAAYGDEAVQVATTVKLGRTLWLIPVAFAFSVVYRSDKARLRIPGFVLMFVGAAIVSSFLNLPEGVVTVVAWTSKALLVIALGMIGLEINRQVLRQMSPRVVFFGVFLWLLVAPLALFLVQTAA